MFDILTWEVVQQWAGMMGFPCNIATLLFPLVSGGTYRTINCILSHSSESLTCL